MSKRVFVSHSSHDMEIADSVVEYLESSGIECWISSRDISPGADWAETIYNAIVGSGVMLLLFSGNANDSWQIRNELDIATNLRVPGDKSCRTVSGSSTPEDLFSMGMDWGSWPASAKAG